MTGVQTCALPISADDFVIGNPKAVVSIKPDKLVFKGETVTLRCDIQSGGETEWKYNWFKNNQPFSTNTATQEISISSITEFYSDKYTCRGERKSDSELRDQ